MLYFLNNYLFMSSSQKTFYSYLVKYPTPINFNYFYNFGSLAGLFLIIQILSGFFLTIFYTPHIDYAFDSIEHLMRDISYGWFIRYIHSNGASFFFLTIYLHIIRGLYYGSYKQPRTLVWYSGMIIYIIMMATAFLGYVLPWGQMSYWAATVITNFITVIPFFGKDILYWLWGGSTINNATLNRFYSLHFLLPFIIIIIVMYHIYIKKTTGGSSNPLGLKAVISNKISFYPYFIVKDILGVLFVLIPFTYFLFFYPEVLGHPDNNIKANPLLTPAHIVPEWYFLPFYGILRSISDKTYGIFIMFLSLLSLFLFPLLDTMETFNPKRQEIVIDIIFIFIFLGYLGCLSPTDITIWVGLFMSHLLLFYIFLALPYYSMDERIEKEIYKQDAISLVKFIRARTDNI